MEFWVYILLCSDGSYYTGHTNDLEHRLAQHLAGGVSAYTSSRLPLRLVFSDSFPTRNETLERERQIKGWSRRKKKALITGDWALIRRLARGERPMRPSTGSGRTSQSVTAGVRHRREE